MRGRRRAAAAVALALVCAALLVRSPVLADGVTVVPTDPLLGFDTPTTQTSDVMTQLQAAGFQAVGIYLPVGDHEQDNRHDKTQKQLTSDWVGTELAAGFSILPIYLGLQAPNACQPASRQHEFWAMSPDPAQAYAQGVAAADDAMAQMSALGMPADAPVYYDLESYNAGCTAVDAYLGAWSAELAAQHHLAGVYGSTGSTMTDLVARLSEPACSQPVAVWAATNNRSRSVDIPRLGTGWNNRQRTNQFALDTSVAYNDADGKKAQLPIDENWVEGPVVGSVDTGTSPPVLPASGPCIPAPPGGVHAVRGNGSATVTWAAPSADGGSAVTGYRVHDSATGRTSEVAAGVRRLRLTGLANGTAHRLSVTALNAVGESVSSATVTVTPAGPPKRVARPTTTVAHRAITVRWRPPAANGARITGYRVTVGGHHLTVAPRRHSATVRNLRPGTYRVTVTAVNAVGPGPASPVVRVRLRSRP